MAEAALGSDAPDEHAQRTGRWVTVMQSPNPYVGDTPHPQVSPLPTHSPDTQCLASMGILHSDHVTGAAELT